MEYMEASKNILLEKIVALVREETGLAWTPSSRRALERYCSEQLESVRFETLSDIYRALESSPEAWNRLIPRLTSNRTGFFRNISQYEAMEILWSDLAQRREERKLTMVGVGCSTGEELYSLCIRVRESSLINKGWRVEVFGADINSESLEQAVSGLYTYQGLEILGRGRIQRWFRPHAGRMQAKSLLQEMISWSQFNIMKPETWPWPELEKRTDVLLIRDSLWSLHPQAVKKAEELAARLLAPEGILISSPTEGLALDPGRFSPERISGLIFHRRLDRKIKANPGRASKKSKKNKQQAGQVVPSRPISAPIKMDTLMLYDRGRIELEAGRYEQAFPYLEEILEISAAMGELALEAMGLAARTHLLLNRPLDAEELAGRINAFSEERPWAHMLQAEARRALGRTDQARESLLRAEEMLSSDPSWLDEPFFSLDPVYDAADGDGPINILKRSLAELQSA